MKIVYASLSGMGKRFSNKLGYEAIDIYDFDELDNKDEDIILVTRSQGFGNMPDEVMLFLAENKDQVIGVVATGNRNWGDNFGAAGDKIEASYGIPLIHKYEGSGFPSDVEVVKNWIDNYTQEDSK